MPELPEVTTTVRGIQKECTGWVITAVWSDLPTKKPARKDFLETIKYEPYFKKFRQSAVGRKIAGAHRRGKNILIDLSDKSMILVHMKMTGHMMVGTYDYDQKKNPPAGGWTVSKKEQNDALRDPFNRFIHVVFTLQKGSKTKHLVLCDSRKFAKVMHIDSHEAKEIHFAEHGPEPLDPDISFADFATALNNAPANNRPIKSLLIDTRTIAGIGNIYSDELLWRSGIHPESKWAGLPLPVRKTMHLSMLAVLRNGIDFGGDSTSDYRDIYGRPGTFQNAHAAYRRTGKPCTKKGCRGTIERKIIGGRSAHFCPVHQKIYG